MQLIVLGMHRSGTSVLGRVLNLMGAYFGPEGVSTGANIENPKGFWERRDVREINDWTLHSVDCDWNRVSRFDVGALPERTVKGFGERAEKLLLEMDAHRPWFIKEPRMCLLMPLWRRYLEVPICIHVVRHPLEVAHSLNTRNRIPLPAAVALWKRYVSAAIEGSRGLPSVVVFHADLMNSPWETVKSLFAQLEEHGVGGLRLPARMEVERFVEMDLYRQRQSGVQDDEFEDSPEVGLFKRLMAQRSIDVDLGAENAVSARALLEFEAGLPPVRSVANARASSSSALVENLRAKFEMREHDLREKLEESVQRARDFESMIKKMRAERVALEADMRKESELLAAREESFRAEREKLEIAEAALSSEHDRFLKLEEEFENTRAELLERIRIQDGEYAETKRLARARLGDVTRLTRRLLASEVELAVLREAGREAAGRLSQAQSEHRVTENALRESLGRSENELQEMRSELARIYGSWTWRFGGPIRRLSRVARRLLSRGPASDADVVRQSALFDGAWYLQQYPDVARNGVDPLEHYLGFGCEEGRDPGPNFSTRNYLRANADVRDLGMNALVHYLRHGRDEGRKLC
ncbi:sulfotransferase family protein [Marilutibacter maris]|uniref:sulfotransferase family protein n=1 Tax=Marilutibacter maris TaxID=1605891 RepID=UPI0011AE8ECB|nr:hypothetical protein [Lysobacter maris]